MPAIHATIFRRAHGGYLIDREDPEFSRAVSTWDEVVIVLADVFGETAEVAVQIKTPSAERLSKPFDDAAAALRHIGVSQKLADQLAEAHAAIGLAIQALGECGVDSSVGLADAVRHLGIDRLDLRAELAVAKREIAHWKRRYVERDHLRVQRNHLRDELAAAKEASAAPSAEVVCGLNEFRSGYLNRYRSFGPGPVAPPSRECFAADMWLKSRLARIAAEKDTILAALERIGR
jgi:hypothetical protein